MKRFVGLAIILGSLSIPALAAKNSENITIADPVQVGSTQLPAGNYKVSWTGIGSNAQVTIAQKGKASVTVPAKVVEAKNRHVAVLTDTKSGAQILESIQLNNLSIVLNGPSSAGE
ncbi:MAG TPA: hypothetical protein VL967_11930 [Terracidiphilus sp.]|nr:hypothetical protein [Terracidiphilus sp.]